MQVAGERVVNRSAENTALLSSVRLTLQMVVVKTLTGKSLLIDAAPTDLISAMKAIIEDKEGIPRHQQRLVFADTLVADARTLAEYNIHHDSTLHLVLSCFNHRCMGPHEHRLRENANVPAVCTCNCCGRGPQPSLHGPPIFREAAAFFRCIEGCDYGARRATHLGGTIIAAAFVAAFAHTVSPLPDLCHHCYSPHPHLLEQNDDVHGDTRCAVCHVTASNAAAAGGGGRARLLPFYRCGSGCMYDLCRLCNEFRS